MNRHFSIENIQMPSKQMKRWRTSLVTKEMQIKTTMRYTITAQTKTYIITSVGENLEKLYLLDGNEKWSEALENSLAIPQKVKP